MVQIIPNVILRFPSTISSAPMETSLTPLDAMKSRALLTLAILWKRILPRSGLGRVSPDITSKRSMSLRPFRNSSSMLSMRVPAFRRGELHHAVKGFFCCFSQAGSSNPSLSHSSSCSMYVVSPSVYSTVVVVVVCCCIILVLYKITQQHYTHYDSTSTC